VLKSGDKWTQRVRAVRALAAMVVIGAGMALVAPPGLAQVPAGQAPAVPVTVDTATRQDVPLWLRGIGTVQALNTVLVRARVDGTLMRFVPTEGQEVKQGDLVAVIDPRPYQAALDQVVAKQSQDEADLANARHDLDRYASLAKQDYASHQQVDTQKALVDHMNAAIAGDVAAVESAKLNLSFCYITSPVPGRVGLRQVDPGNLVHATDPGGIVTITQVHPISVVFTLPQDDLPAIVTAMAQHELTVAAWSNDGKIPLAQGALLTPDNAIDATTGTIKLKATFPNQDNKLWPGQFVAAQLLLRTDRQVVTVPTPAVQHGPVGLYVYVVQPDSTVHRVPIDAEDRGVLMVVTKGLEPGQRIVLDGQSRLENGSHITATTATAQTPQTKS
jgi:multidrug efflux system membrane fusion protein